MSSTILTDIVRDYEAISTLWFSALSPIAQRIFWTLVAIQLTWSAMWWALDREDGLGVITSLLRQVVAIGFFYALLVNGATWIPAVTQSFSQAGATAAGIPDLSPSGVFDQGLALANRILNSTADKGLLDKFFASLVASVTALIVVVAFAIIAAQLLVVLVESFIVVGAGVLFLGFAGSQWTRFFTERYLSYIASVGVRLFVLYLIMGVGMDIAARWMSILERGGFSPIPFFYVMGGSLVFVFLTWHIPSVAGSLMAGAVSLSLADAVRPATAMSGVRWGVDRLRGHASLHTVNGDSPRAQPPGAGASAPPAPDVNQARSPGKPEPERRKALQPAGKTRDPDVSTSDRGTPLGGREPE